MTEVYKVGVKLMMSTNAMSLLPAMSKELLGLNSSVAKLAKGWSGVGLAIKGAMAFWAGEKMLSGLVAIVEKTKDLSHELTQVRKLGQQSETDMKAVYDNALNVGKKVRGISYADILKIYSNVYDTVGGDRKEALALMAPLAKFDVVAGNTLGKFGQSLDPNFNRDTIKSAEQMGRLTDAQGNYDEKKFLAYTDMITKLMTITHGAINPQFMRQMATTGGPVFMGMNDQSLLASSIVGQYMGASRTGTAEMSLMQQFAGGTMFKRNAEAMQAIGLLGKDEWKVSGGRVILAPEARKRLGDLASDPWKLMQTLKADMVDHGITDQGDQIKELFALFARQTTQRFMADLMRNSPQIAKAMEVAKTAMGVDASYNTQQQGDVAQKLADISVAYDRLWNVIAGPKNEAVIAVLDKITGAIEVLTDAAAKTNPATLKNLGIGIGILGAALIGGSAVALLAFLGPAGWLAAGVIALGAAAVVWGPKILLYLNPATGVPMLLALLGQKLMAYDWQSAFGKLVSGLESLWEKLKGLFGQGPQDNTLPPGFAPGAYHGGGQFMPISYTTSSPGMGRSGGSSSTGGGAAGAGIAHYGNLAMGGGDVNAAIAVGAAAAGMDVPHFKAMASIESSLNPMSNWNKKTQYKGLFQIGRSEWRLHGHGNIYNAMDNALAMAALVNANKAYFRKHFGRDPTPDEIYLMHQQGPGFYTRGAMTNIGGNPYPGMRGPQNHNSFEHGWSAEVERRAHIFGGAVPPPKSKESETHVHKLFVDGREVAHTAMRHIANGGEKAASGGRMYDRSYTRPITI